MRLETGQPCSTRGLLRTSLPLLPVVLLLLTGSLPAQAGEGSGQRPEACLSLERATAWLDDFVVTHGRSPRYEEVVVLPGDVARRVVPLLTPEGQADFWRRHLSLFLETDLQPNQRTVLKQVMARLVPEFFRRLEELEHPELSPGSQSIQKDLLDVFPRRVVAQMLSPTLRPAPPPGRLALLQLSPQRQFDLWQAHLRSFLQLDLTDEQNDALLEAIALLTPELFVRQTEGPQASAHDHQRVIQEIEAVLSRVFSPTELAAIGSPTLAEWDSSEITATEDEVKCDCHYRDLFSCGLGVCLESNGRCEWQNSGCGFLLLSDCNGGCCAKVGNTLICPWGLE